MAQPNAITHDEIDQRFTAFSGYVEHLINMNKSDTRRSIVESEQRLETKIDAVKQQIKDVEQQLNTRIDAVQAEVSHIKTITLANTKMLEAVMQNLNAMSENIRKISEKR